MFRKAFIIFSWVVSSGNCQELIYWNSTLNIKWSDFKGTPPLNAEWTAASHVAIDVKSCPKSKLPDFLVVSWFNKGGSWTLDRKSSNLLEHEQLHFDIKELFARKIRYSIDSLHQINILDFAVYTNVITRIMNQSDTEGDKYDKETSYGMNLIKQKEWNEKISFELELLKKYKFCPCLKFDR